MAEFRVNDRKSSFLFVEAVWLPDGRVPGHVYDRKSSFPFVEAVWLPDGGVPGDD